MGEKTKPSEPRRKPDVPQWKQRVLKYMTIPILAMGGAACGPARMQESNALRPDTGTEQSLSQFIVSKAYPLPAGYREHPQLELNDDMRGTDQGGSVLLPNGTRFFVFGDTYKSKVLNDGTVHWFINRNSASIVDEKTNTIIFINGPKDTKGQETTWLTPKENDGSYYWPLAPILGKNGQEIIVPMIKNKPPQPGANPNYFGNFAGIDLVKLKILPGNPYPQFDSIVELPRTGIENNQNTYWGAAGFTMKDPDTNQNYGYIYGTAVNINPDNPWKTTRDIKVARVVNGDYGNLAKWEFWDGKTWQASRPNKQYSKFDMFEKTPAERKAEAWQQAETKAVPIITDNHMKNIYEYISSTFSVLNINGKIVLINKPGEFMNNRVTAAVANRPQGPFGPNQTIIDAVLPYDTDPNLRSEKGAVISYSAVAYLDERTGKLIISVSRNFLPDPKTPVNEQIASSLTFTREGGYKPLYFRVDPKTIVS